MRSIYVCFFTLVALIGLINFASAQSSSGVVGKEYEASGRTREQCAGNFCRVYFPVNSLTKPIKITQVSCQAQTQEIILGAEVEALQSPGYVLKKKWLVPGSPVRWSSNTLYTTINDETSLIIGPNRIPGVSIYTVLPTGNAWELDCRISGEVLP